jgi:hypothetical protein
VFFFMALDTNHPQDGTHAAGELSPTSLDTVCALTRHEGEQFTLPGFRATVALAEQLGAPINGENVSEFNQRQRYHAERWIKRAEIGKAIARHAQASENPLVKAYGAAMGSCSEDVGFFESPRGALMIRRMGKRCNKNHCPECRRVNNQVFIRRALPVAQSKTQDGGRLRFIVLTWANCPNTPEALKAAIEGVFKAWVKLRRQAWIKDALWGTIATFEVTLNAETGMLNPHLNVLILGPDGSEGYIPQAELSKAWEALSGCPIVHIQGVLQFGDEKDAFKELVKYISKGNEVNSPQDAETLILGTRNMRLRRCTGEFFDIKDEVTEAELEAIETEEQLEHNADLEAPAITKDEAKRAVLLGVITLSELKEMLDIFDTQVRLAPAFFYAKHGSIPIAALAAPPSSH